MEDLELQAQPRAVLGKKVKVLRRQGVTPANLYGYGEASEPLQFPTREVELLLSRVQGAALLKLRTNGGAPRTVLLKHVQRHPVDGRLLHLDLQQVAMTEEVRVPVPVHLVGEAPVMKTFDAAMVQNLNTIEITARASDLPSHLEADISIITDFNTAVHVRDIRLPAGVQVHQDPDDVIATAVPSAAAIEEARQAAEAEAAAVEARAAAEAAGEAAPAEEAAEPSEEEESAEDGAKKGEE